MPEQPNPNLQDPAGGTAPAQPPGATPPVTDPMETLKQKKGWKTNDEVVKFAEETEKSFSREQNKTNKLKQQLETAGYTIDEDGNIKSASQPPYGQPAGQPPAGQPLQETIYDPYTGVPITDPIALQLVRLPPGQREAVIFNALQDQRDRQQNAAYQHDVKVLAKPEAKGFEDDVRKVMMALPLAQRSNEQEWENALLRVKGTRYDADKQIWAQHGVEGFINKENIQGIPGTPGTGGGEKLTPEEESSYTWYQQNQPGMFKDKAHFKKALNPTGGR